MGETSTILDRAARNVETCDVIEKKLDEVDKELP